MDQRKFSKKGYRGPGYYNLIQSFGFALWGIRFALTRERNLRIHFAAGAFVVYLTRYYGFSRGEYALLFLAIGFVLTCEMFNTAIEKTVDLETTEYHSLAKIAKDVAAGAVLVSAATSVLVGGMLFWDTAVLRRIWGEVLDFPLPWIIFGGVAVAWVMLPEALQKSSRDKPQ